MIQLALLVAILIMQITANPIHAQEIIVDSPSSIINEPVVLGTSNVTTLEQEVSTDTPNVEVNNGPDVNDMKVAVGVCSVVFGCVLLAACYISWCGHGTSPKLELPSNSKKQTTSTLGTPPPRNPSKFEMLTPTLRFSQVDQREPISMDTLANRLQYPNKKISHEEYHTNLHYDV
jgi:hypothetical protein